jgi:hypothetical protein
MAQKEAGTVPKSKSKIKSETKTKTKSGPKAIPKVKPATKSRTPSKPKALSPAQKLLLDRLAAALPVLDEECLEALVQSAENLAESCRQDRMLEEARSLALEWGGAPGAATRGKAGKKKGAKAAADDDSAPIPSRTALPAPLSVEASSDGRFFHIVVDGKWKMLNRDELKSLVNIAVSKDPAEAVRTRLFTWLKRERADVLSDLGISTGMSPILAELAVYLKKNFKIKK